MAESTSEDFIEQIRDAIKNTEPGIQADKELTKIAQLDQLDHDQVIGTLNSLRNDLVNLAPDAPNERHLQNTYVDTFMYIFRLYPPTSLKGLDVVFDEIFPLFAQIKILRQLTVAINTNAPNGTDEDKPRQNPIGLQELAHLLQFCRPAAIDLWKEYVEILQDGPKKKALVAAHEAATDEGKRQKPLGRTFREQAGDLNHPYGRRNRGNTLS